MDRSSKGAGDTVVRLYEVIPDALYTSACPDKMGPLLEKKITTVVCLSTKKTPIRDELLDWVYFPIPDSFRKLDRGQIASIVELILDRLNNEHRVLIHCLAGRNRAALVAALVYREVTGCSGEEAFQRLRKIRPSCLHNPVFEKYLRNMGCL